MKQYLDLLSEVFRRGDFKPDRTGTGTKSLFGAQLRFNMADGFPLLTTKKLHFKSIVHELLWFLRGDTNVKYLQDNGVRIWNEWADEFGELGPIYGYQWRFWQGKKGPIDQITKAIDTIKNNPTSRRIIVSAWNVSDLDEMRLPPCHMFFQYYVNKGKLSLHMYMRSADMFLGVPFDIASYGLLLLMTAQVTDLEPGDLIISIGDAHIYANHMEQVLKQLLREPKALPTVKLNPEIKDIFKFKFEDITLENYDAWPHIPGKVAI